MPLIFVFVFSAGKEAIEDYARYAADTRANNVPYSIIRNGTIHKELSMNIRPGDIFYVEKGEKFPVDAMLISSSYEDGTCFVETAELDGETNLKRRSAVMETCKLNRAELVAKISGKIECEHPNENLNVFTGRAIINHAQDILNTNANSRISPDGSVTIPLNMNNILLRGAVLRNTDFAFGLVIYTGKNTKIIRNLKKSKQKTSKLEGKVNYFTLCAFGYFLALLISSVILEVTKYRDMYNKEKALKAEGITDYIVQWYIGEQDTSPSKVHHTQK
jgi:phospholipid-transporting ATPase